VDYIQVKAHHGFNHIYCPFSFLTIDDRTEACPDGVFVLPITASFKINNIVYHGTKMQGEHEEFLDPLYTMRVNLHFQPKFNLSYLMQDPLVDNGKPIQ